MKNNLHPLFQQLLAPYMPEDLDWKAMDSAPKDGTLIQVTNDDGSTEYVTWNEQRNMSMSAGWATTAFSGGETNLPVEPIKWRKA